MALSSLLYNPAQQGMGIGSVGVGDPNAVFKRKNRWTLEITSATGSCAQWQIPPYFVKLAARPNVSFEETEINWLNDKMWIPGKATWEAITVTFLDVAGSIQGATSAGSGGNSNFMPIYVWLSQVYNFTSSGTNGGTSNGASLQNYKFMSSRKADYTGVMTLTLFDGCGQGIEQWQILDGWPQAINFGDLDQASSDVVEIEMTIRYSQVQFNSACPPFQNTMCCTPCS